MTTPPDVLEHLRTMSGCTQKTFLHRLDWAEGRQILDAAVAEIERLRALVRAQDALAEQVVELRQALRVQAVTSA